MAGSFGHVLNEAGEYHGTMLLGNMGDMKEAVDQMFYMLLYVRSVFGGDKLLKVAEEEYYQCVRGERPWPEWWKPEDE